MNLRFIYSCSLIFCTLLPHEILLAQPPPCDFEMEVEVEDECGDQCDGSITVLVICPGCTSVLYSIDGGVTVQEDNTFHDLCSGIYDVFAFDEVNDECFSFMEIELGSIIPLTYYKDMDGDGFGDPNVSMLSCSIPIGYVLDNTDPDDSDPCTPTCHDPLCAHSIRLSDISVETKCEPFPPIYFGVDFALEGGVGDYTISNNLNGDTWPIMPGETVETGPFPNDAEVVLSVTSDDSPFCTVDAPGQTANCDVSQNLMCIDGPPDEIYTFEKPGDWTTIGNWKDNKYPTLTVDGKAEVNIQANCDVTGVTLTNYGSIYILSGRFTVDPGATVDNYCNISIEANQNLINWGKINNKPEGSIFIDGSFLNSQQFMGDFSLENEGFVFVGSDGSLSNLLEGVINNLAAGEILNSGLQSNFDDAKFFNFGTFKNSGQFRNSEDAKLTNKSGGEIINLDLFINRDKGICENESGATFDNEGELKNENAGTKFSNDGMMTNAPDASITNSDKGEMNNNSTGHIENYSEANIQNREKSSMFYNRGVIKNQGKIVNELGAWFQNRTGGKIENKAANVIDEIPVGIIQNGIESLFVNDGPGTSIMNNGVMVLDGLGSRLINASSAKIQNNATIGLFESSILENSTDGIYNNGNILFGGTIQNLGHIENPGTISCKIVNQGTINPPQKTNENLISNETSGVQSSFLGTINNHGSIVVDPDETFENGSLVNNYGIIEVNGSAINYSCAIIINDNTITNNHRFKNQGIIYQNGNMTGVNNGLIIVNNLCLDATQDISLGISSEGVIVSAVDLFIPEAVDNCLEIFIDGQQSKTYFEPGEYIETITVTDELGNSISCERTVYIADYIPTLSQWALVILGTLMVIFGVVGIKQRSLSFSM